MFWFVTERSGGSSFRIAAIVSAGRVAPERALAREHLVQDHAESEDVASGVGGPGLDLLGRHVAERSHDDAGSVAVGSFETLSGALDLHQLREAEVEDLDAALSRHEEVLGLQVPVDDPFLVSGGEALGDLNGVVDRLAWREAPRRRAPHAASRLRAAPGRRTERRPDARCRRRRDVGVIEDPGGAGLLLEALQAVRVARKRGRQDLDRDLAAEPRVLRPVDLAHPARAEGARIS